jgi:hypothetical protein
MNSDVINCFWMRDEFSEQRGDWQTNASIDIPGADLLGDDSAITAMQATPLGMPPTDFDVKCIYDSRPLNGYDFNFSASQEITSNVPWSFNFDVPNGYRIVPREWDVFFDTPIATQSSNSTVTLTQQNAGVPNNSGIIVGMGTGSRPIKSFFVCEENTQFGISGIVGMGSNATQTTNLSVNVYGNLIPVTEVSLPFCVANDITKLANTMLSE